MESIENDGLLGSSASCPFKLSNLILFNHRQKQSAFCSKNEKFLVGAEYNYTLCHKRLQFISHAEAQRRREKDKHLNACLSLSWFSPCASA